MAVKAIVNVLEIAVSLRGSTTGSEWREDTYEVVEFLVGERNQISSRAFFRYPEVKSSQYGGLENTYAALCDLNLETSNRKKKLLDIAYDISAMLHLNASRALINLRKDDWSVFVDEWGLGVEGVDYTKWMRLLEEMSEM